MSIYLNLDYGERQELFEGAELRSRISRQAEWEKHYIKNGSSHLGDENFDLMFQKLVFLIDPKSKPSKAFVKCSG